MGWAPLRRPATAAAGAAAAVGPPLLAALLLLGCACPAAATAQATPNPDIAAMAAGRSVDSILAHKWLPGGYDWSRAGYAGGERAIPSPKGPIFDVTSRKYGAVGNGIAPCDKFTAAIRDAAASPGGGVVYVPARSFLLNYPLYVNEARVVIRGAGPARSKLLFGRSLGEIYKGSWAVDVCSGKLKSMWTANGGLVTFSGKEQRGDTVVLSRVVADAQPGTRWLYLSSTKGLRVGQMYQLLLNDQWALTEGPEQDWVNCSATGSSAAIAGAAAVPGLVRVPVTPEQLEDPIFSLALEAALEDDDGEGVLPQESDSTEQLRRAWFSEVAEFNPGIVDSGIEHLTVTFKNSGTYAGHLTERGYNGVLFYGATNCWARDLRILDADNGVLASESDFITAADIVIDTTFDRSTSKSDGNQGHHAFNLGPGQGYLMTRFDVRKRYYHDLTASQGTLLSVFSQGRGLDICMDNHRGGGPLPAASQPGCVVVWPMANLFSKINLGRNTRAFQSSGRRDRGAHTGRGTTFWNVFSTAKPEVKLPDCDYGPYLSYMLPKWKGSTCSAAGWWVGTWKPALPRDLSVAQATERRRLMAPRTGK
ncbi:hypothetical protein ABPG75_005166 [Micractinium tetrahymenae]